MLRGVRWVVGLDASVGWKLGGRRYGDEKWEAVETGFVDAG